MDISIHSLRMEGDATSSLNRSRPPLFQSTPSVWRETSGRPVPAVRGQHFNPLPPYGGRPCLICEDEEVQQNFNPLPPYGGRPHMVGVENDQEDFNPLPPYGGRRPELSHLGQTH